MALVDQGSAMLPKKVYFCQEWIPRISGEQWCNIQRVANLILCKWQA
jgi:hypothetical protein